MGKNLHRSIIKFIEEKLKECDKVVSFQYVIPEANYYIIKITRKMPYESFKICVSDDYRYTLIDFINRPKEIEAGDFIYLARPESGFSNEIEILETALEQDIYIGKFADLLSFLNKNIEDSNKRTINRLKKLKDDKNSKLY